MSSAQLFLNGLLFFLDLLELQQSPAPGFELRMPCPQGFCGLRVVWCCL